MQKAEILQQISQYSSVYGVPYTVSNHLSGDKESIIYLEEGLLQAELTAGEYRIHIGPVYPDDLLHDLNVFQASLNLLADQLHTKYPVLIEKEYSDSAEITSYQSFETYFRLIQKGDLQQLQKELADPVLHQYFENVAKGKEDAEIMFLFALCSSFHHALSGGLEYEKGTLLLKEYLSQAAAIRLKDQYFYLWQKAMTEFAKQVNLVHHYSFLVRNADRYIEDHYRESLRIGDVSNACGVSVSSLQHTYKKEKGISIMQAVENIRIEHAADDLLHTRLTCTEIAWRNGYESQSRFIQVFRKHYSLTPLQYRMNDGKKQPSS